MTGAGPRLAAVPGFRNEEKGRSPLAHLLHEFNQPLTGLQCSMELVVAGPRPRAIITSALCGKAWNSFRACGIWSRRYAK